jgi:hypothetical protein
MNDVTPTASLLARFSSFLLWYFYNCCQTRARGDILFLVAVSSSRWVIHIFLAVSLERLTAFENGELFSVVLFDLGEVWGECQAGGFRGNGGLWDVVSVKV